MTIAARLDSGHQVFFHIGHTLRHAHRDERGAFPGLDAPEVSAETEGRGAGHRRASKKRSRRNLRRDPARLGQLAEHVQIFHAREAVGPECHIHVHRVEGLERRRADADVSIAARARHECDPERSQSIEIRAVELHPVHGEHRSVEEPHLSQILRR